MILSWLCRFNPTRRWINIKPVLVQHTDHLKKKHLLPYGFAE